jgi:hypothetical protein
MPISVKFDKNGFHHPIYGRMGRGRFAGMVYILPEEFAAKGMLPSTAVILESDEAEDLLEETGQRKAIKPAVLDAERYERVIKTKQPKASGSKHPKLT